MYAIVQNGSHQYRITPGMEFQLYNLSKKEGEKVTLNNVLLLVDDAGEIHIGKPYVSKASISLEVKKALQGKKIDIMRFRAKSRYTKRQGFREDLTLVKVEAINLDKKTYKADNKASKGNPTLQDEVKQNTSKEKAKLTVDSKK